MWLFALFDLPVKTKRARKRYTQFRTLLLQEGFSMLQYSVYARYCASEEHSTAHRQHIRAALPPDGHVRLISITDRQFEKMDIFLWKIRSPTRGSPDPASSFLTTICPQLFVA